MAHQLVDHLGRPVSSRMLTKEIAGPTLTGVRQVIGSHPEEGLTPGRLAAILKDSENGDAKSYLELAEAMEEKDLHYRAVIGTRKGQVSQLEITVEPASDAAEDVANQELVEGFLERDELRSELCYILDAVGKGYSVTEIVWETSERQWMPERLEYRFPQWFEFDRNDGRTLHLLTEDARREPLAPFKFIQHVHKSKSGLPIRGGLARAASWSYLFKNYDIKDWVSFAEVYGQPLRVGKYHPGATEEDRKTLLRAVASIGSDAAAIIPDSMMMEFVEAKVTGTIDLYERLANYLDTQVSKAVLGQTTTTDAISGGHAVSKEHDKVREDIEAADAMQLAAAINRDLVRPMVELNRGPQKAYPRIRIGQAEQVNVPELADAVAKLVPLGLKVSQAEIRQKIGVDEPDDESDLLGAPLAPPPPPSPGGQTADPAVTPPAGGGGVPPGQDPQPGQAREEEADAESGEAAASERCPGCGTAVKAIAAAGDQVPRDVADQLTDRAEAQLATVQDALIDGLRAIVENAESLDDVSAALLAAFPDIKPDGLAEALRQALVVAELAGRSDIVDQV